MTEPEFPPITLKTDASVGVYFLCDEAGADDLRDCLKGDAVKFSFNPSEGAHLAEAGKVLFVFGLSPFTIKARGTGRRVGVVFRGHHAPAPCWGGLVRARERRRQRKQKDLKTIRCCSNFWPGV